MFGGMQVNKEKLERIPRPLKRVHETLAHEIGPPRTIIPLERRHEFHRLGRRRRHRNQRRGGRGGRGGGGGGWAQAHEAQGIGKDATGGP